MTDPHTMVAATYTGLADLLASSPDETWDAASLCTQWRVRHIVAHVTMPARLTAEQFGAEMAAAGGDFGVLSERVAAQGATLPAQELLAALRNHILHTWEPPVGGAAGALSHAVIHSLDVTVALGRPPVAPPDALDTVLESVGRDGSWFGVDLTGRRFEATDSDWASGDGDDLVRADRGSLIVLLAGRTLPDGTALPTT